MKIGIDVGGTNTDAVLMDDRRVLSAAKRPTTEDVIGGITAALSDILRDANQCSIERVVIGTTHFVNAFAQRRSLERIGSIRVAAPATLSLPPLCDWPQELREVVEVRSHIVHGGVHVDGQRLAPLDEAALRNAANDFRNHGISSVAITSLFSPISSADERRALDILRETLPDCDFTLSSEIGRIGLLERENATIINAMLRGMAKQVIIGFRSALAELGVSAPFFISRNDGTMINPARAMRYPVLTFSSGPTNSMRGGALFSGLRDAVIVDIGGTTTDIGVIANGYPREAGDVVKIGGVRTNFRMPDVLSLPLGGGTLVREIDGKVVIGPDSLGYRLHQDAMVFGGTKLTVTDLAVASGALELGTADAVSTLPPSLVERGMTQVYATLEEGIDSMKTSSADIPVVLVGGGAALVNRPIGGKIPIRPPHADVANAVGAALSQVCGELDQIMDFSKGRDAVLSAALERAHEQAKAMGAAPGTLKVVDMEEVPVAYLPGHAVRVRIRVVGDA
jgi:N-methylhydantoinase A/oxoprolinase/acetone carboxylase beta subunit